MDEFDYWRVCDALNAMQAAALITNISPARVWCCNYIHYVGFSPDDTGTAPDDPLFQAAFAAIKNAIQGGTLKAKIKVSAREYGEADAEVDLAHHSTDFAFTQGRSAKEGEVLAQDRSFFFRPFPDWELTTLAVDDLRAWLASRGVTSGFFFPSHEEGQAGYLDRNHPNYAPKLAAAIRAWEAVTSDPEKQRGKTPKAALSKWLNEHAAIYGLTKDDGTPNATGVEEAAKLANWKPEGGATKTPNE